MKLSLPTFLATVSINIINFHDLRLIFYYWHQSIDLIDLDHIDNLLAEELGKLGTYFLI